MRFFRSKKERRDDTGDIFSKRLDKHVGQTKPICPYCLVPLEKMPGRKKKCPSCGSYMFVRTRSTDSKKILIREDQIDYLEAQWHLARGTHDEYIKEKTWEQREKAQLANSLGREPSEGEVELHLAELEAKKFSRERLWGLFRNSKLDKAKSLMKLDRFNEAVVEYCGVCYLDMNGPLNRGLDGYGKDWDPHLSFDIVSGILAMLDRAVIQAGIEQVGIYDVFSDCAEKLNSELKLPIKPDEALKLFRDALQQRE